MLYAVAIAYRRARARVQFLASKQREGSDPSVIDLENFVVRRPCTWLYLGTHRACVLVNLRTNPAG
jgi:hypothetical protein